VVMALSATVWWVVRVIAAAMVIMMVSIEVWLLLSWWCRRCRSPLTLFPFPQVVLAPCGKATLLGLLERCIFWMPTCLTTALCFSFRPPQSSRLVPPPMTANPHVSLIQLIRLCDDGTVTVERLQVCRICCPRGQLPKFCKEA
jgi:hypothetical protein